MGESREWYALVLPGQTWPQRGCGWRRLCTCCLELQTFVAFDQPLQRLNALVEELEIPDVQRILQHARGRTRSRGPQEPLQRFSSAGYRSCGVWKVPPGRSEAF